MTAQTLTLTQFLLDRIAEDEAVAQAAIDPERPGTDWQWAVPADDPDALCWLRTTEEFPTRSGVGPLPAFPLGFEFKAEPSRGMAHIARWDPARVLAECEAKRTIVDAHPLITDPKRLVPVWSGSTPGVACETCGGSPVASDSLIEDIGPCDTLRALASVYADHPLYRSEWNL